MTLTSCSNPNESLELRAPMTKQLGILVSSYDAYSDLWPPFFAAFHRSWPDCPFQMYLLSNRITFPDPTVKPILVGDVTAWPESIRLALEQISEDFVLLFLEDWFLQKQVDTGRILRLVEWVTTQRPACIRLQPAAGMVPSEFKGICHLPPGIPYRSSTVPGISQDGQVSRFLCNRRDVPALFAWCHSRQVDRSCAKNTDRIRLAGSDAVSLVVFFF